MTFAFRLAGAALGACLAACPALAMDLAAPEGRVLLTVSGEISNTNAEGAAAFDMDMLQDLPAETVQTTTIWTEGEQTFVGVHLSALLDHVGAAQVTIHATAINDYAVDIPHDDWSDEGPVLAYLRNGEPMSLRDKGPLWIIYPFDSDASFRTEVIYSRSIWQLDRIIVGD
ncbi:MAG: oxidoreductase [Rhodobacteraceae bacterium]|nr:oxidoreductase [Paracoccaceae bacterium]